MAPLCPKSVLQQDTESKSMKNNTENNVVAVEQLEAHPSDKTIPPMSVEDDNPLRADNLPHGGTMLVENTETTGELAKLGEEFRKSHQTLEQCKVRLQADFKQSTAEAIACGRILIEAKELAGYGGWLPWLKEHANISESTAQRYMHLARNSSSMTNLTEKSLTECYTDLGLLKSKESEPTTTPSKKPEPSDFLRAKGLVLRLSTLLTKTNDPERMVKEIEPILQWHKDYLQNKGKLEEVRKLLQEFEKAA
jgi:hypothetical protein